ncbi:MAG TPA: EAL domain-containing protein [Xanthomonadaceae bacterium]|nr:EAL domain-containing protein [Xanthomonadaceae bacterium]
MIDQRPNEHIMPGRSIRWKLAAAFLGVACFVAAFVGVAIGIHLQAIERAAQLEATHVAELMADTATDDNGFKGRLQELVSRLHALQKRDFAIVDTRQVGLADSHLEEVGKEYVTDPMDEVGQTIRDGKIRTFVEHIANASGETRQLVVPIRHGKANIGAVILEYSPIREELFAAERASFYLIMASGTTVVLLITLFGLGIASRIAKPLVDLKDSAVRIATQDYTARVAVASRDEIGLLGAAFNKMAEDLGTSHAGLVEFNTRLDSKVSERTRELSDSALASLNMMEDAIRERENTERALEKLNYLAYYDPLTGLANRGLFLERVAQYLRGAATGGHGVAVGLIDLERFKNINDSLGQLAGDALLKQVADWLARNVGDANLVARIDADHFAIVLPEIKQDGDLARLLDKMIAAFLAHPFRLNDAVFRIGAKGGVALFPDDGDSADVLFRYAEAALKQAKAHGDRYLFYTQAMTDRAAGKPTLENQLRQAIDNEEFVLHYQPKVNLVSGLLVGAEALIRWNDPRTGLVPPFKFIPILEETGLIHEVGRWAMRKAIEDYLRWRSAGLPAVRIAVNVSALQLRNRGFIAEVKQAVGVDEHAAAGLELEITESMVMEDIKQSIASLQVIRDLGVSIAIDDFGTGFSSLGYLSKLPIDTLKIDRSFVVDMTTDPQGLALVSTIINLAHSLNLKVVGEGVETEEQSRLLRLLGCDEMQGYLFSKPVPGDVFEARFLTLLANAA